MDSTKARLFSTAASIAASAMLLRAFSHDFIPREFQIYISSSIYSFLSRLSSQFSVIIEEFESDGFSSNHVFEAAELYLDAKTSPSTRRVRVTKPERAKTIAVAMERDEEIVDTFEGIKLVWRLSYREPNTHILISPNDFNPTLKSQTRYFLLTFHKKQRDKVLGRYLPHVIDQSKAKGLKLYTIRSENMYNSTGSVWSWIKLDHPATFETMAMEPEVKGALMADLERFVRRRELYRKAGRAWKRGYLLYGPPGTGKSSLIAAIANYLKFNVYDLELSEVRCNSELRRLLVATASRSVLVMEDIDCAVDLENRGEEAEQEDAGRRFQQIRRQNQLTLSGLLNFIDGLWSSCGDERIIIFTTNHKEKLDRALLRPGRMDMHIHMSYCTPHGIRVIASNYIGIQDHPLFQDIEALILEVEVTPAQVAEELLKHELPETALLGLLHFLSEKKMEAKSSNGEREKEFWENTL